MDVIINTHDAITETGQDYPWMIFSHDGTEYCINSKYVLTVEILGEIIPMMDTDSHCIGLVHSRDSMIELLDLRSLYGCGNKLPAESDALNNCNLMVVIEVDGKRLGVIADQIVAVERITRFETGVISRANGNSTLTYISRVAKREKSNKPLFVIYPEHLCA